MKPVYKAQHDGQPTLRKQGHLFDNALCLSEMSGLTRRQVWAELDPDGAKAEELFQTTPKVS